MHDQQTFTPKIMEEWDSWFEHAWPLDKAAHDSFVEKVKDGSHPLAEHFFVPRAHPDQLTDDPNAGLQRHDGPQPILAEEIRPIERVTHPGWTEAQMNAAVREEKRALGGDLYALQPELVPPRCAGMRIFVYNLVPDVKRVLKGTWVPATLLRAAKKGDKHEFKRGRPKPVPLAWWWARYWDGEVLPFRLAETDFKHKTAGNGWVLDVHNANQPKELLAFCQKGRRIRTHNVARRAARPFRKQTVDSEDEDEDNSEDEDADDDDSDDGSGGEKSDGGQGSEADDDSDNGRNSGMGESNDDDDNSGDTGSVPRVRSMNQGRDAPFPVLLPPIEGACYSPSEQSTPHHLIVCVWGRPGDPAKKDPARLLPPSLFLDGVYQLSPPISGGRHLCWARAWAGECEGSTNVLLQFAENMAECLVNVERDVAQRLSSANSGNAPGQFTKRILGAAGNRMLGQIAFMKANPSWNWASAAYPLAFPHFVVYAYVKSICFVVVQAKTPAVGSEAEGYFALLFGIQAPRVLNLDQLRGFMQNKRPQDACVLLEGFTDSVATSASGGQYCHFAHHIELVPQDGDSSEDDVDSEHDSEHGIAPLPPMPPPLRLDDADCEDDLAPLLPCDMSTDELVELMRRNAWISNAVTQKMDQPKHVRTVRENARDILTRQGALAWGRLRRRESCPGASCCSPTSPTGKTMQSCWS